MSVGRNDPCPCGSGKKYKQCHRRADEDAARPFRTLSLMPASVAPAARPHGLPSADRIADRWDMAIVPAPMRIGDQPNGRPVLILVTAGPLALHVDVLPNGPAELEPLAREFVRVLDGAIANAGKSPAVITLEHIGLARALRAQLQARAITVRVAARSVATHSVVSSLMEHLAPGVPPRVIAASHVQRWAAWGWPDAVTLRLHAAAAAYFRAAPWTVLADDQPVAVRTRGSKTAVFGMVLGQAGETFGVALHDDIEDALALFRAPEPDEVVPQHGLVMSLTFDDLKHIPASMRKEVRAAGWEVNGPRAWPVLMAYGSPGGGVTVADAERLIAALEEIPAFVDRHRDRLSREQWAMEPIAERGVGRGVRVEYRGYVKAWEPPLWAEAKVLTPCGAEGNGAEPALPLRELTLIERRELVVEALVGYETALRMSSASVVRAGGGVQVMMSTALALVGYQLHMEQITPAGLTELHLRRFLYEILPLAWPQATAGKLLAAVRHFLTIQAGASAVRYPWAAALLADKAALDARLATCPSDDDQEAIDDWLATLDHDLRMRLLIPYPNEDVLEVWPIFAQPEGAALHRALVRAWLGWRDALVRSGVTDGDQLEPLLLERQRAWLGAPQEALGGRTPKERLKAPAVKTTRRTKRRR